MEPLTISSWDTIITQWESRSLPGKLVVAVAAIALAIFTPLLMLIDHFCKASPKCPVLDFYDKEKNCDGVTIDEMLSWDDKKLEENHRYIQWLFPIKERSQFNIRAPLANQGTMEAFKNKAFLQSKMRQSLDVMLKFYGFKRKGEGIERDTTFAKKAENWLTKRNHNFLRISRILTSLRLHGLEKEAEQFYEALKSVYNENEKIIGKTSLKFWTKAAGKEQQPSLEKHLKNQSSPSSVS